MKWDPDLETTRETKAKMVGLYKQRVNTANEMAIVIDRCGEASLQTKSELIHNIFYDCSILLHNYPFQASLYSSACL